MPRNLPPEPDAPFQFADRPVDPTGRRERAAAPPVASKPRRRRSAEPVELEDLLRQSIREVMEREIRKARTAEDLTELLRLSITQVRTTRKKAAVSE